LLDKIVDSFIHPFFYVLVVTSAKLGRGDLLDVSVYFSIDVAEEGTIDDFLENSVV